MRPRTENERRSGKTHDAVVASDAEIAWSTLRTQSGNVKCITIFPRIEAIIYLDIILFYNVCCTRTQ